MADQCWVGVEILGDTSLLSIKKRVGKRGESGT